MAQSQSPIYVCWGGPFDGERFTVSPGHTTIVYTIFDEEVEGSAPTATTTLYELADVDGRTVLRYHSTNVHLR